MTKAPVLDRLEALYSQMDREYAAAARHYGFQCDGCDENCCLTRFYHHTVIEYIYLMKGVAQLPLETQNGVFERASQVIRQTQSAELSGQKVRLMCPLNHEGLCLVYPFRPMICRLHGIAHELHRKGGVTPRGEGCSLFDDFTHGKPYFPYDRTPFYTQMALLEVDVRKEIGFTRKFKKTVAEMLLTDDEFGLKRRE